MERTFGRRGRVRGALALTTAVVVLAGVTACSDDSTDEAEPAAQSACRHDREREFSCYERQRESVRYGRQRESSRHERQRKSFRGGRGRWRVQERGGEGR
jgi:hypothetical protein